MCDRQAITVTNVNFTLPIIGSGSIKIGNIGGHVIGDSGVESGNHELSFTTLGVAITDVEG